MVTHIQFKDRFNLKTVVTHIHGVKAIVISVLYSITATLSCTDCTPVLPVKLRRKVIRWSNRVLVAWMLRALEKEYIYETPDSDNFANEYPIRKFFLTLTPFK